MATALGWFRLPVRMQRLEVLMLVGGSALLATACLVIAWQTRVTRADDLACLQAYCPEVPSRLLLLEHATFGAGVGGLIAPVALGLFLGIPIVARDLEGGTAAIAWSLARSRGRWLLWRSVPILALALLAMVLVGVAEEIMTRSAPWLEGVDASFDFYGARGPLVVARGLAALGLGAAVGALIPRQLPALLVAGGIVLAATIGLAIATDRWMQEAAVPLSSEEAGQIIRVYDSGFRNEATGLVLRWEEFAQQHPEAFEDPDGPDLPGWTPVMWVLPGSAYETFVVRESAIMLGLAALGIGVTVRAVGRHRP